ncbi:MAG: PEP-CTERM sorting domain-containing protein [Pseudomonadota bacterium]
MRSILPAALLGLCLSFPMATQAEVLTFDDLVYDTPYGGPAMPQGYGGLYWIGWNYYSWDNPPYNAHSGETRLFHMTYYPPTTPSPNAVYSDNPVRDFVFDGAWFAGYSSFYFPKSVSFALYNDGVLVHQSDWLTPTDTSAFLASGYAGAVDRVELLGDASFVAMDDFQFHFITSVPEPETYAMMLAGIALLATRTRRRR